MASRNHPSYLLTICLILCYPSLSFSVSPCVYDASDKGEIDITSLGRVDGSPKWKDQTPQRVDNHVYSYNPCRPFTLSNCKDVAACQTFSTDETLAYSLGTQNSIQWQKLPGQELPNLVYTSGERTLVVELKCRSSGPDQLDVYGQDESSGFYKMTLTSKCACWNGCKGGSGSKLDGGLSGGTIFIIALVALVFVYLLVFMAYNKIKKQAVGLDILPHREFWVSVPTYSLNGVTYVFRKVTGKSSSYNSVP